MALKADAQLIGDHGGQGSSASSFTRMLKKDVAYAPLRLSDADTVLRKVASHLGQGPDVASDEPDDQENPYFPAAYTYLGQFIDHDITFDNRSTLKPIPSGLSSFPSNERTPRLDMDCLYGLGPASAPYMYGKDGKLATNPDAPYDLPRSRFEFVRGDDSSHRAIIGDPRNDENSIVCQLQLAFIHLHNAFIDLFSNDSTTKKEDIFSKAQREVRFTYQKIIVSDFLKRLVRRDVYDRWIQDHKTVGSAAYNLYVAGPIRTALPLEFTGAAYRFGHSGVRNGYRLNRANDPMLIFDGSNSATQSLVGFGNLPADHIIEWDLFVSNTPLPGNKAANPAGPADRNRLQFAYKIDTSLVDPLLSLPPSIGGNEGSLAFRNIMRGYNFSLPSGQDIAKILGVTKHPPLQFGEELLSFGQMAGISAADALALEKSTPLWLYILAEAQADMVDSTTGDFKTKIENGKTVIDKSPDQGTQLGPVGGRILLEVFFAMLDEDKESYFKDATWKSLVKPNSETLTLWDMLRFIGKV